MGAQKKTRKFQVKKIIGQRDARLKKNQETGKTADSNKKKDDDVIREA
jgi:U3 small nucleolar RNA-associated protein 24